MIEQMSPCCGEPLSRYMSSDGVPKRVPDGFVCCVQCWTEYDPGVCARGRVATRTPRRPSGLERSKSLRRKHLHGCA